MQSIGVVGLLALGLATLCQAQSWAPATERVGKVGAQLGCPGTGDCCVANGTTGCEDAACCGLVCAADPFCCDVEWDNLCADAAQELCAMCDDPNATGACCWSPKGTLECIEVTEDQCDKEYGGKYFGDGTSCQFDGPGGVCEIEPVGACCVNGDCSEVSYLECVKGLGGEYFGDGSFCFQQQKQGKGVICGKESCGADHCEEAGPVCPHIVYEVDNFDATSDYFNEYPNGDINDIFFCNKFFGVYDVWCKYTPAYDGLMFTHIEGPSGEGVEWVFGIYDDCPAGPDELLVCNVLVHHGVIVCPVQAYQTYWIRAAGRDFSRGSFVLNLVAPDCVDEMSYASGPGACSADLDGSGLVDDIDLVRVLRDTKPCPTPADCPSDVNLDGIVDGLDVLTVMTNMGRPCTGRSMPGAK